jgi:hypothetical protein
MNDDFDFTPPENSNGENSDAGSGDDAEKNPDVQSQEIQHSQIGALVPEKACSVLEQSC